MQHCLVPCSSRWDHRSKRSPNQSNTHTKSFTDCSTKVHQKKASPRRVVWYRRVVIATGRWGEEVIRCAGWTRSGRSRRTRRLYWTLAEWQIYHCEYRQTKNTTKKLIKESFAGLRAHLMSGKTLLMIPRSCSAFTSNDKKRCGLWAQCRNERSFLAALNFGTIMNISGGPWIEDFIGKKWKIVAQACTMDRSINQSINRSNPELHPCDSQSINKSIARTIGQINWIRQELFLTQCEGKTMARKSVASLKLLLNRSESTHKFSLVRRGKRQFVLIFRTETILFLFPVVFLFLQS